MIERDVLRTVTQRYERLSGPMDQGAMWGDGRHISVLPQRTLQVLLPHRPELPPNAIDRFAARINGVVSRLSNPQKRLSKLALQIIDMRPTFAQMDKDTFDAAVRDVAQKSRIEHNALRPHIGPIEMQALAVVGEAIFRLNGFYPHREQIMGATALLEGSIAEMATGEGKTLTAAIAAIVAGWRGLPCHVITSNDYLAARDCEIGAPLFALCKVSATSLTGQTPPDARAAAYAHDIVYTTAKDMLADHLRDAIAIREQADRFDFALRAARSFGAGQSGGGQLPVVMRGAFQLVVDEADSVLIDEAITPLIISEAAPDDLLSDAAQEAVRIARLLVPKVDFEHDETLKTVELTRAGRARLPQIAAHAGPFWRRLDRSEELVKLALHAIYLMKQDQNFVVEDGKVVLVDELTGRLARQRTLSLGLQQVLEASLDLATSDPSEVRARLSFQRYFARMPRLGGMTGTAREARSELAAVYGLKVLAIPTHRPTRRTFAPHRVFLNQAEKFAAIAVESHRLATAGHAVLIGLRSVQASEALAQAFAQTVPQAVISVLNAVNDAEESAIVSRAGQSGAITIATNMAGRGTDIKIDDQVASLGGLHVLIGESNDFGRIDRQLIGRCARQGDPGVVIRFMSCDDEVVRRFLPPVVLQMWHSAFALTQKYPALAYRLVQLAQWRAEKLALSQRKSSLKAELQMEKGMI
jgi:preprotein translocase subunit SecA